MKLRNAFTQETRLLYLYQTSCFICGSNGNDRGGLEIHHILGRISKSAFNSSCLCGYCHKGICHNKEEHREIFFHTIRFLKQINYQPKDEDWEFLKENFDELVGEENKDKLLKVL